MKTVVKAADSDLFFVIPGVFVESLKWKKGDVIDIELVDDKLLMSKI